MGVLLRLGLVILGVCSVAHAQSAYGVYEFAGTEFGGDGQPATRAPLVQPQGIAVDRDGSIVFADAGDHRVRRFLPNGFVSSVAGDGIAGPGMRLRTPYGVAAAPNRDIYVADLGNARVVRVAPDGSRQEFGGFQQPRNVAVDPNGVVYVSDFGANTVYKLGLDGSLKSVTAEPLRSPAGLTCDSAGVLYVADSGNQRVIALKNGAIRTVLKDFGAVTSIAVDGLGKLYAAGGDRVAVVAPSGEVTILMTEADEVALDIHGSLIAVARKQIRTYSPGGVTVLAGNAGIAYTGDGRPRDEWRFLHPTATIRDSAGNLYIADTGTGRVRRIDPEGNLSTLVASLGEPGYFAFDLKNRLYFSDSKSGSVYRIELDGTSKLFSRGSGTKPFVRPLGLAFDKGGRLYVADTGNAMLRRIDPDGFVSTIAGGGTSTKDGFGTSIALESPVGIAVDGGNTVWFTEAGRLRKMGFDGRVVTLPNIPLVDPRGLHLDSQGRLLVADAGANRVLRVDTDGTWEILADTLNGPTDAWQEADGSILVADSGSNRIRRLAKLQVAPVEQSPLRVIGVVVPGGVVELESDQAFPSPASRVWFGDAPAEVLSAAATRIVVKVPEALPAGWTEVRVEDWAVAPVEIVASARIENEDGSINSSEHPASRTGWVTVRMPGSGSVVTAEIASLEVPVVSVNDSGGQLTIVLQLPGGFLPSGRSELLLWVDGKKAPSPLNIMIR
ncbi:MAG TPA: hypothetical protein VER03_18820 [Bryobacteraceae bacterium]|nr:hypothetical protein [Bryobacteraceae bacterium]